MRQCGNLCPGVTVEDNVDPSWSQAMPSDVVVNCESVPDPPVDIQADDTCDNNVEVTFDVDSDQGVDPTDCTYYNYTVTRTWIATDDCGNSITHIQTITVQDVTEPSFDPPADVLTTQELTCGDENDLGITGFPTNILDNCAPDELDGASGYTPGEMLWTTAQGYTVEFTDFITLPWMECSDDGNGNARKYRVERTWTITDPCGNSTAQVQNIDIIDNTSPEIICPPLVTIECDEDQEPDNNPALDMATATDNCDDEVDINVTYDDMIIGLVCPGEYMITRTWTATDLCGNTSACTQTIEIYDTTPPVFTVTPSNITVECGPTSGAIFVNWQNTFAGAVADDNCSNVTLDRTTVTNIAGCGTTFTYTMLVTAEDECGLTVEEEVTFTVEDTTPPDLSSCDGNLLDESHECSGEIDNEVVADAWNQANVAYLEGCASDSCGTFVVTSDYDFANLTDDCGFTGELIVTYSVTDECGNTTTISGTLTITDTTSPDLTLCDENDLDSTIECEGAVGNAAAAVDWDAANILTLEACATDICGTIAVTSDFDYGNLVVNCGESGDLTVIYTVTDECGNTSTLTGTLVIEDTTPPALDNCVEDDLDQILECLGTVGNETAANQWNADNLIYLEGCALEACGPVTATSDYDFALLSDECGESGELIVTFTVTDECGLSVTVTGTLTIVDTSPPDLSLCDPNDLNLTHECDGTAGNEAAADSWHAANLILLENCAIDLCGTFTVVDDYDFANFVPDCGESGVLVVTYTLTDDCGNEITTTGTFTVEDTTPPDISICDENDLDLTLECAGAMDNDAAAVIWNDANIALLEGCASDLCGTISVTSDYDFANLTDDCGETGILIVIYTVTDDCGNTSTLSGALTIEDLTAPDLSACVGDDLDMTHECDGPAGNQSAGDAWNATNITLLEGCAFEICGGVTVTSDYDFANLSDGCGVTGELTVTYTVSDDCGNSSMITGTLTIEDNVAPDLAGCDPAALMQTIECSMDNEVEAEDWNTANLTLLDICASESCSDVTVSSDFDFGNLVTDCGASGTLLVTYSVTDGCNTSTIAATLTIEDTTSPDLSACASLDDTHECDGLVENEVAADAWNLANVTTLESCATDNCGAISVTENYNFADLTDECALTGTLTVTYTVTDDCGNTSTVEGTFTIMDTTPPDWDAMVPGNVTVECDAIPTPDMMTASDACDDMVGVTFLDADTQTNNGSCTDYSYTISRTWTATDDCGNTRVHNQIITVEDTTPPAFMLPPDVSGDEGLQCGEEADLSLTGFPSMIDDNCAPDEADASDGYTPMATTWMTTNGYSVMFSDAVTDPHPDGPCSDSPDMNHHQKYLVSRTWTITDPCGNASSQVQSITIDDDLGPDIVCPDGLSIECDEEHDPEINLALGVATATDNCDDVPDLIIDYADVTVNGACDGRRTVTRTWSATDLCGNSSTCDQVIEVYDVTPPVFDPYPSDMTVECGPGAAAAFSAWQTGFAGANGVDNCSSVTRTRFGLGPPTDDCGSTFTYHMVVRLTDACGNAVRDTVTFDVEDTVAPSLASCDENLLDDTHECDGPAGNESAADGWDAANISYLQGCATDACGSVTLTSDYDFANLSDGCGETGELTVTYTVTDECGNTSTISGTLSIEDNIAPDLTACDEDALDMTHECDGVASNEAAADAWNAANIAALEVCASELCSAISVTSDYDFSLLSDGCGESGELTVTYTVSDGCNSSTITGTFTIEDNTAPDLSACDEDALDLTHECDGAVGNEATADAWNAANLVALEGCAIEACGMVTVTHDYDFGLLSNGCGETGALTVTYTVTDECGLSTAISGTFTIEDTTAPDLSACDEDALDLTHECDGAAGNEVAADAWNTANVATLEGCAIEACGSITVTHDYDFLNLSDGCAETGEVTVTYTVTDECGLSSTITGTFTVEDTTSPDLTACDENALDLTHECDGAAGNEVAADAWNAANVAALESCASDLCGTFTVTTDYNFLNLSDGCGESGELTVTYSVTDECGNTSTISGT
ncbi:MAG: hypothetical protein K9I85_13905, partial [Saprospiraceae bacterium]|nr:hypothetical protein [Saprospiraceae bacterium]